jgi:hypothetical protein
LPGQYSHEHPVTVHHGPMAGKRGDSWEADAIRLEQENAERIENPMPTLPNQTFSNAKGDQARLKSDEGTVDEDEIFTGGDTV